LTRRRALLAAGALLVASPAAGQQAEPARPRPRPRSFSTQLPDPLGPPAPPPRPSTSAAPAPDLAPMPNRSLEPPRIARNDDLPSVSPSIIHRRLPGQGQAAEGSPHRNEERLFAPAPGARVRVPFSY
jgi:hypothetical protein